jgi:hypothetical protein
MEIETSSKLPTTPSMVQPIAITKLVNSLRGGTCLTIIPLHVQTFTIHIPIVTIVSKPMKGSERSNKEQVELVNPSFTILNSRIEFLELLSASLHLTQHQIGIG